MVVQVEKYLRRFLEISPIALALWRSVEAKHLATVELKSPILDIGCGFGEFALAFFDKPVDVGIDISPLNLFACAKTNKYKNLVLGDARKMPFTDKSFSTVFSISTLEHISHVEKVLRDTFRILKPNGIMALTIETTKVDQKSVYRSLFRKIHLPFMSVFYSKIYNKIFKRHTLLTRESWKKKIIEAGFEIEKFEDIISPQITTLFEIFLATSWPSQIFQPILGKRVSWRPNFMNTLLTKLFLPYIAAKDSNGTNLFVVARKPLS